MSINSIQKAAIRRKYHIRKKVFGTAEQPRLAVFRSNRHIYAQIIDDTAGVTLVSASTVVKGIKDQGVKGSNKKTAEFIGTAIAKEAIGVGIKCVCFDRAGYRYHGKTKALADAARKAGLAF